MFELDGYTLINPLSYAQRIRQTPDAVLDLYFGVLTNGLVTDTNKVVFAHTSGLYMNTDTPRMSLLQHEGEWRRRANKTIATKFAQGVKTGAFDMKPDAFSHCSWDDDIARNWQIVSNNSKRLHRFYASDTKFRQCVDADLNAIRRTPTKENLNFLFEETALTSAWMQKNRQIIVYPGDIMPSMLMGLRMLFNGRRDVAPVLWINTQKPEAPSYSTYALR